MNVFDTFVILYDVFVVGVLCMITVRVLEIFLDINSIYIFNGENSELRPQVILHDNCNLKCWSFYGMSVHM